MKKDRGYAWVILCACVFLNILQAGSYATVGVYYVEFLQSFDTTNTELAWIGTCLVTTLGFVGLPAGTLINRFGHRTVIIFGVVFIFTGCVSTMFVSRVPQLYLTYGFTSGVGYGLHGVTSHAVIPEYFNLRRSFAAGALTAATGVGLFAWSPLVAWLISHFSWRGALLIHAGIQLNALVIAALIRPFKEDISVQMAWETYPELSESKPDTRQNVIQERAPSSEHSLFDTPTGLDRTCSVISSADSTKDEKHLSCSVSLQEELSVKQIDVQICYMLSEPEQNVPVNSQISCVDRSDTVVSTRTWQFRALELTGLNLLCKPLTLLQVVSCCCFHTGHIGTFTFLSLRGIYMGVSEQRASFLLSILGISACVFRVTFGVIGDRYPKNKALVGGVTLLIACFLTGISSTFPHYWMVALYAACYGALSSGFYVAEYTVIVDILGMQNSAKAMGFIVLAIGVASLLVFPITGALVDGTSSAALPFVVYAGFHFVTGCLQCIVHCLLVKRRKSQNAL